jgi:hypothetical protein
MRFTQTCPERSGSAVARIACTFVLHGPLRLAPRVLIAALILALTPGCGEMYTPWQPVQPRVGSPAAVPHRVDFTAPPTLMSPGWSAVGVYGVFDLAFAAMVASAITLALAHGRRARAATMRGLDAVLRDGPAEIAGVVEIGPGEAGAPVVVEIDQAGTEGVYKPWHEADVARPFWLRLDRDPSIRVRIEPDEQIVVRTPLGRVRRIDRDRQTRFMEVGEGEIVRVTGVLRNCGRQDAGGVYREMAEAPVLRPPAVGPMVIVTEAHRKLESARACFHASWAIAAALLFVSGLVFVAPAYHLLSLTGTRMTAVPDATRIRWARFERHVGKTSQNIGYQEKHYEIRARLTLADGRVATLQDECSEELYDCVGKGGCTEVPFVVSTLTPSLHQMGERPTLSPARMTILALLSMTVFIVYRGTARKDRPS